MGTLVADVHNEATEPARQLYAEVSKIMAAAADVIGAKFLDANGNEIPPDG